MAKDVKYVLKSPGKDTISLSYCSLSCMCHKSRAERGEGQNNGYPRWPLLSSKTELEGNIKVFLCTVVCWISLQTILPFNSFYFFDVHLITIQSGKANVMFCFVKEMLLRLRPKIDMTCSA